MATDLPPSDAAVGSEVAVSVTPSRISCEAHREFIEAEAAKGRNAFAIYQDLVEHHGFTGAYNAVKRFVRKLMLSTPQIKCRFETLPGEEMQVDYGEGAKTRNPRTGKYGERKAKTPA